jgi:type II secretory pathway component PulJ
MLYTKRQTGGYSLAEMIFYVAILAIVTFIVVGVIVRVSQSRKTLASAQTITNSAIISLDRMVREIRLASSAATTTQSDLLLTSVDSSGSTRTVRFLVATGTLRVLENNVDTGPLTESGVNVSNLSFYRFATSSDVLIKIEMTLESGTSTSYKSENFYSTAILRQSL